MMDPRMMNSMNEFGDDPWGGGPYENAGGDPFGSGSYGGGDPYRGGDPWGGESMEERMLERRAQRMYQDMAMQGRYGEIDKAKHNKNYRNYLLQNYDEMDGGFGY